MKFAVAPPLLTVTAPELLKFDAAVTVKLAVVEPAGIGTVLPEVVRE